MLFGPYYTNLSFLFIVAIVSSKMFKLQNRDRTQEKVIGFVLDSLQNFSISTIRRIWFHIRMVKLVSFGSSGHHFHHFHVQ